MAHYALLDDNNVVTQVITGRNEDEVVNGISDWEAYYGNFHGQVCKRTSYNTHDGVHYDLVTGEISADQSKVFRGTYAGIGFTYDPVADVFVAPDAEITVEEP